MKFDRPHVRCKADGTFVAHCWGRRCASKRAYRGLSDSSLWRAVNSLRRNISVREGFRALAAFDRICPIHKERP